jgi:acyl carrier protein
MERQEAVEKITGFARKALAKKDLEIAPDARLKDLGLNSAGRLELFTMIEDEWDLMMEEEDQDKIKCVNDAVDYVMSQVG